MNLERGANKSPNMEKKLVSILVFHYTRDVLTSGRLLISLKYIAEQNSILGT